MDSPPHACSRVVSEVRPGVGALQPPQPNTSWRGPGASDFPRMATLPKAWQGCSPDLPALGIRGLEWPWVLGLHLKSWANLFATPKPRSWVLDQVMPPESALGSGVGGSVAEPCLSTLLVSPSQNRCVPGHGALASPCKSMSSLGCRGMRPAYGRGSGAQLCLMPLHQLWRKLHVVLARESHSWVLVSGQEGAVVPMGEAGVGMRFVETARRPLSLRQPLFPVGCWAWWAGQCPPSWCGGGSVVSHPCPQHSLTLPITTSRPVPELCPLPGLCALPCGARGRAALSGSTEPLLWG